MKIAPRLLPTAPDLIPRSRDAYSILRLARVMLITPPRLNLRCKNFRWTAGNFFLSGKIYTKHDLASGDRAHLWISKLHASVCSLKQISKRQFPPWEKLELRILNRPNLARKRETWRGFWSLNKPSCMIGEFILSGSFGLTIPRMRQLDDG